MEHQEKSHRISYISHKLLQGKGLLHTIYYNRQSTSRSNVPTQDAIRSVIIEERGELIFITERVQAGQSQTDFVSRIQW